MVSLYLMGLKGYHVLNELLLAFGNDFISSVIASRDKNVQDDYYQEIEECCRNNKIIFFNRKDARLNSQESRIAIGWKWLIPDTKGLIILHDSLLPKYRGFNPLVTALLEGDTEIGATAILASQEADEGAMVATASRTIAYPITIAQATSLMAACYVEICLNICKAIKEGRALPSQPQNHALASYSLWRDELDYLIDWSRDAAFISRFIDAHGFPYKNAASTVNGQLIRIREAELSPEINIANRTPGKIFKLQGGVAYVVCGTGIVALKNMVRDDTGLPFVPETLRTRFL